MNAIRECYFFFVDAWFHNASSFNDNIILDHYIKKENISSINSIILLIKDATKYSIEVLIAIFVKFKFLLETKAFWCEVNFLKITFIFF